LERKAFKYFIPKRDALSGFNRIQCIIYPIISIPGAEDNQKDQGENATAKKSRQADRLSDPKTSLPCE